MNKKGLLESNVGKAILALILIVAILFIIFLAKGALSTVFESLKKLLT